MPAKPMPQGAGRNSSTQVEWKGQGRAAGGRRCV